MAELKRYEVNTGSTKTVMYLSEADAAGYGDAATPVTERTPDAEPDAEPTDQPDAEPTDQPDAEPTDQPAPDRTSDPKAAKSVRNKARTTV